MLKRLELVGFKSFADKTQFNFPAGITAVVGPNGSGKSNIVDAVRWILGEQSAKSLRGGEMADVIFNGSTSRKSLAFAEVTMTFDNSRHILATDAAEVDITRRVYRSGEGEYLINHHLCRLKDIKELFLGTGAGTNAYCIIEQGRVDVLLQSSTKERRTIFEEAAGISRFKSKKIEAQRKLEKVEQNLQRLRDIIDEVEKQLRSVKVQAAKAQRYQEYTSRLREVRILLGLHEWHGLSERLRSETAVLDGLRAGLEERSGQALAWEAQSRRLEESLAALDGEVHGQEGKLASARQQIAAAVTTLNRERTLSGDLETDLAASRIRIAEVNERVATLAVAVAQAAADVDAVEKESQEQWQQVRGLEEGLNQAVARLAELHTQIQRDKVEHLEQMRQAARLQNDVVSYKSQADTLHREAERLRLKSQQAAENLVSLDLALEELTQADEALQARLVAARQALANQRQERERVRQLCDQTAAVVSDLRAQRSGVASRIEVLEGLERSHEGLGTGVREVLDLLAEPEPGPWRTVLGMVADLLTVQHEYAPLIDLALGDRAQRFVVRDPAFLAEVLKQRGQPFSGRVSFVPITLVSPNDDAARLDASTALAPEASASGQSPRLIAADKVVRCDHPELADLPAQLLGRTIIVPDLVRARQMAAHARGLRLVTFQGEILEPDGTLTIGTHHAETGLVSRKSELRELRHQAAELDRRISEAERDLVELRERLEAFDAEAGKLQEQVDVLAEQGTDLRSRLTQQRQRREGLHEEVTLSQREISAVERERAELEAALLQARVQVEAAEQQVAALQARLEEADKQVRECEAGQQQRQQEFTTARVTLAKVEERLANLRVKYRQIETDLEQRRQEQTLGQQHMAAARARLVDNQRTMLEASASLAHCYLDKEAAERRLAELTRQRDFQRQERQLQAERAQTARAEWQAQQEQAHAHELEANELRHRRDTLADRLREDYQLELAELYERAVQRIQQGLAVSTEGEPAAANEPQVAAPDNNRLPATDVDQALTLSETDLAVATEEIAELRRKLNRLGSVNLDSLQELAELETRGATLQLQFEDLTTAKRSLEEIINTINQDSRRLFTETFATIRGHFQELFRKLFGGGMADVVLEDETDILESGIEVIARPPGKELRSISLMSGGEKTMTAVALLLAIFRSKPSPFCILDEVDAALDEANIGRYTSVLRDFLDRSQFIIITHSKRTMAAADVLYGITMQESGISKQVAVRFEDWPDDGSPAADGSADGQHTPEREQFAGR